MIAELSDIAKTTRINRRPFALFDGLNLRIEEGEHVGILGLPRTGKTTLLRILNGIESTDSGVIRLNAKASWLIPESGFLSPRSSMAWNIRWVGRIFGVTSGDLARQVGEMGGLTQYLNRTLRECPRTVRQQFAVYLPLALPFGLYLFDGGPVIAKKEEREAAVELFRVRTKGKTLVIAADSPPALDGLCDSIYVLENGRARSFATPEDALEYFKKIWKSEKGRKKSAEDLDDDEESAAMADEADTLDQVAVAASDF